MRLYRRDGVVPAYAIDQRDPGCEHERQQFDTVLAVYTGTSIAALSPPLVCNDDLMTLQAQVSFAAEAGTTYYFQAGGFLGTMGTLKISVGLPPVNDDFANAIIIPPALPYSTAQSTMSTGSDPGEPAPCGKYLRHGLVSASRRRAPGQSRSAQPEAGSTRCWSCGREQASIRSLPLDCNRNFVGPGSLRSDHVRRGSRDDV